MQDRKAYQAEYRAKNAERLKEYRKAWYRANREVCREKHRTDYLANADARRAYSAEYRAKFPDLAKARVNKWHSENRDKVNVIVARWRDKNRDEHNARNRQWAIDNPHKKNAKEARRRAACKRATPAWADDNEILSFYETANMLGMHTGEHYHVDHIVPLNSKIVCGLHCHSNLQVLIGSENIRKSNKFWPNHP